MKTRRVWPVRWSLFLVLVLMTLTVVAAVRGAEGKKELILYVAENGRDDWSGRLAAPNPGRTDGPFASLTRSRDVVRALRSAQPDRDLVVQLRGGTYFLAKPLEFTPQDSGRLGGSVTYAAYPGEKPVISGGRLLPRFRQVAGGLWQADIPEARSGAWRFEQLYVNGRRATRARTPNRGYFYTDGSVAAGKNPVTGKLTSPDDRVPLVRAKDLAPLLSLSPERLSDVVVSAYYSWDISRHHLRAVDGEKHLLYLTGRYPPAGGHESPRQRYFLENFREALDAPGEWFLDRDGTLTYKPLDGESLSTSQAFAPVTETLIRVSGTKEGQQAANINFRGITFRHAGYRLPPDGEWSAQAACKIDAAIMVDYSRNVRFEGCAIENTGGYGIWFRNGCRECVVERCFLGDLGAGGVRLGQTSNAIPAAADVTGQSRIDNNIIRGGGRVWPDAAGILIGHSGDNQVTHNDISLLAYTGISVGWHWGFGDVPSKNNIISFNHIHHLGWDVLSDMGGIYTLGESPGTIIDNNVINDIDGDGDSGMHGLYNDNSSSFMHLENNLVYNVRDGGYIFGDGRDNVVRNNIFAADPRRRGKSSQLIFWEYTQGAAQISSRFEHNIVYGSGGKLFTFPESAKRLILANNIYWEPSGADIDFAGKPFNTWQALGRDKGSVIADPGFLNPARGDFRLRRESPALKVGFVPFDPGQAGVYGDPAWVARAGGVSLPPWQGLPPPPPMSIYDDFESTAVGAVPADIRMVVEGKGDSIGVTEATAATGRRSLKITDVPGLTNSYDPHFWYSPDHRQGITTLSFDLRLDQGAELVQEWRESPGKPYYYVGPRIDFRGGKILVSGRPLLDIPTGVWFHLEISAGLGPEADGTWLLTVTLPGEKPRRFTGLVFGSPQTRALTWLGFISTGSAAASYYLDNIRLTNSRAE